MVKVAVVILNWNGKKFLEKFLPNVIEHSFADAEIIVADNASKDDSVAFLQKEFPQIRIIQNKENYGFAKGYNEALKQVKAEYYILLNSDIEVTENWISPAIDFMDKNLETAACQPKILNYNQKDTFEYAGASGGFIDKYGYPFCRGRIFMELEQDNAQYDDTIEVFWATGACLFVRSETYWELGGLDDDFFAHMEEIDFCWRAKNKGYKINVYPKSVVYHIGGGTLPKNSPFKTYLNIRNNLSMLYKNLPKNRLAKVFIARYFLDLVAAVRFLFSGGFREFFAVGRAHLSFIKHYNGLKKKRKTLQQLKVSKIYRKNIVFEHYVKGKKQFTQLNSEDFS